MNKFLGIFNRIEQIFVLFGGVLIIILMIMTIIDVSGRSLFRFPLVGSVEISELVTAVIIVLAISFTQKNFSYKTFPQSKNLQLIVKSSIFFETGD